jgi:micrococcal nuclease
VVTRLCAFALLPLVAATLISCTTGDPPDDGTMTIVRVVDGDTVIVRLHSTDETVRLIGIDTPETKHPTKPVQCFGPEASSFTDQLLPAGTRVRLERDVEARDHFGRLLAYVYRSDDGLFVNLELARQGYARPLAIAPNNAHARDVDAAAGQAQAEHRGLWQACPAAT